MDGSRNSGYFPVAIIGIGCRMPGGVNSTEDFWAVLRDGKDCITDIPSDRWSIDAYHSSDQSKQGKMVSRRSGFIDGIDQFDNTFFKISPKEAASMDPQQRILLEVTHEAFEDAGIVPDELKASCGVFVGIGLVDYGIIGAEMSVINAYTLTGSAHSVAANRLSYAFDLKGPSFAVDTACASSMTAMHLACSALWNRECELSVLAGANAVIIPETTVGFSSLGVLSPEGKCCPFSDAANGYVRSEGWGTVILKPLDQAISDNDNIYATIIGTHLGANGNSHSLTMPSVPAQQHTMEETYRRFGVSMADVEYLEAHGTGTPVGDPIEAEAIGNAFGPHRKRPLKIGSVKSNFGHSECSAGVVATIKSALMLHRGYLVPSVNYQNPNPNIHMEEWNINVQTSLEPLKKHETTIIGINSFGFAGALAHAILQTPPKQKLKTLDHPVGWRFGNHDDEQGISIIIPLSAKTTSALEDTATAWKGFKSEDDALRVIGWQATHRKHYECRLAVIAKSGADFQNKIEQFITDGSGEGISTGTTYRTKSKICFVFPGQGQQWADMGRQLYCTEPLFRETINKCDDIFRQVSGWSLVHDKHLFNGHYNGVNEETINDMVISQPAIMFLQIGLYELWRHWGIEPDVVVGHSLGEVAAAYACGGLTLAEAVKVIYYRSTNQTLVNGAGSMVAVKLSTDDAEQICNKYDSLYIAAENAPGSLTLAGSNANILSMINNSQIKSKQLRVQCAFHTPHMDPMEKPFRKSMQGAVNTPAETRSIPFYSTLTGEMYSGDFKTDYWWGNIRSRVKFQSAIENILRDTDAYVFVECAASATLLSSVKQIAKKQDKFDLITITSGQRQQDDRASFLNSLGQLYVNGIDINWKNVTQDACYWVNIPKYPWQHTSFWFENEDHRKTRLGLDDRTYKGKNGCLSLRVFPFLADHVVQDRIVFPAAGYVEYALQSYFKEDECPVMTDITFKRVCTWPDNDSMDQSPNLNLKCVKDGNQVEITGDNLVLSSCKLLPASTTTSKVLDIEEMLSRCDRREDKKQFYARMASVGLNYGPYFQVVESVMVGDGEVVGYLCPAEDNKQRLQTTQLDGCFQLLLCSIGETSTLYIPVGIGHLQMYVPKIPYFEKLIAYVKVTELDSMVVVGDITLTTKDGCVLAHVSKVKCQNISGTQTQVDLDKCLYQTVWQPFNSCMGGTSILREVFAHIIASDSYSSELEGIRRAEERVPTIKGICASYIRNGLKSVDSNTCKINSRYLKCLQKIAADDSVIDIAMEDIHARIDELIAGVPAMEQEFEMIRSLGDNFPNTLKDPGSAVKILFQPEYLPKYFMESLTITLYYKAVAEVIARSVKKACEQKQVIRILEIGGRMGGLARHVLEPIKQLGKEKRLEYIFTDLSATFFKHAQGTLEDYPFVKYKQLDIENDVRDQGFIPGSIDIIVCVDAIHPVVDMNSTIGNVRNLLVEDGLFLMMEGTNASYIIELVFGSLDLCWCYQDFRTECCWLSRDGYAQLLTRNGFADVVNESTPNEFFHTVYLGRNSRKSQICIEEVKSTKNYMLVLEDEECEFVKNVKRSLSGHVSTKTFMKLESHGLTEESNTLPYEIIYVWSESDCSCHYLLKLLQIVDSTPDLFTKLWVVTCGSNITSPNVDGSKAIGLTRAVTNQCTTPIISVDIDPHSPRATQAEQFMTYITSLENNEREVVIRDGTYLYPRVANISTENQSTVSKTPFWQLTQSSTSAMTSLDDLGVSYASEMVPDSGKVLVQIKSTALNFKDVMMALGMLDALIKSDEKQFGLEFSGIVEAVGEGVTTVNVGDEVIGMGEHCFASHSICDARLIVKKPANLSWDESAGVSIVFATAYHSLIERANLKKGETVLIHSACGGVGLSAIQVARMAGANIICSVGTQTKRTYLKDTLGIEHVTNSRTDIFYNDIMEWTNGHGVDVVLNSLHGELFTKGIQCLAPGGRFCEIGKRDILQNSNMRLDLLLENKSFLSCQIDFMVDLQTAKAHELLTKVSSLLEKGIFQPVQHTVHPITDYQEVFIRTAKGAHIGKVIFTIPNDFEPKVVNQSSKILKQNATYVITGAFGGIGLALSRWVAKKGAKHIVMVSKRGCRNSAGRLTVEFLKKRGVNVYMFALDLSKQENIQNMFEEVASRNAPAIKGIFHLAGYIASESLETLTPTEADNILDAKSTSAQLFHNLTKGYDLDIFFTLSSVTSLWGNAAQPMYVAANNALDALAEKRKSEGLAALTVQLGAIRGAGYLEGKSDIVQAITIKGNLTLHVDEFLNTLSKLLQSPNMPAVVCLSNQEWSATQVFTYGENLRFQHFVAGDQVSKTDCSLSLDDVETIVREKLGKLLFLEPDSIDINQPMINYGVDSLMAVEMVTWASKELSVVVSQLDILGGITTKVLLEKALNNDVVLPLRK